MNKKRKISPNKAITRMGVVNMDILPQLRGKCGKNDYIELFGVDVKVTSQRYSVFKKSSVCCACGIAGKYFAVEKNVRETNNFHLNLYAVDADGNEVLMTKDHIIAVSNGGKNNMANYQTMCYPCNKAKANK